MRNTSDSYLYLSDEHGRTVIVEPGDDVPSELADRVHNDKHVDGDEPDVEEPVSAGPSQVAGYESSGDEEAEGRAELEGYDHGQLDAFADRHGIDLTGARTKAEKIDAIMAEAAARG